MQKNMSSSSSKAAMHPLESKLDDVQLRVNGKRKYTHMADEPSSLAQSSNVVDDVKRISDKTSSLTIIDWDDTLNPSDWCGTKTSDCGSLNLKNILASATEVEKSCLKALSAAAAHTIKLCLARGVVVIVTNAAEGWTELSASILLPDVLKYVSS